MRIVTAILKNRMAYLGCSQKTEQLLSEFWSFYVAGARWARSHKLWLHKRQEAIDKGKSTENLPGWDGKIYFLKRGAIPEGLFRATYREAEEKLGIRFRIEREGNPANGLKVREITRQKDTRYSYQDDCIVKMQKALKRGGGLVLMATGCLDGNSYIDTPRDLRKYPHGIKIRDLVGTKPWVYCYDNKHERMTLAQASSVHRSGRKVPVYRVTFEPIGYKSRFGGRVYEPLEYIDATAEHLFLMRDVQHGNGLHRYTRSSGAYKAVRDLVPGDRVMPFFRQLGAEEGYATINLNNGDHVPEHRFILSKLEGRRDARYDGHHKDESGLNNCPDNLEWLTKPKHYSTHASKRNLAGGSLGWQNTSGVHPRGMTGKPQTKKHKEAVGKAAAFRREKQLKREPWRNKEYLYQMFHVRGLTALQIANIVGSTDFNVLSEMKRQDVSRKRDNHVVRSVEFLGYRDVYDITVPKHHNFVANGIVVHNSGKTSLAGRFFASLRKVKCLFVVDTLDLMYQAQKELARWAGEPVGIVGNSEWEPQRITVATRQTLNSNFSRKTAGFEPWLKSMSIVIVDEIHEQMSKKNFAILNLMKPVARYGLTATLQLKKKEVRMKAYAFTGPVVYEFPLSEGTKRGVLSKGRVLQLLFPEEWEWTEDNKNHRVEYEAEVVDNVVKLAAVKRITRYLVAKDRYCMTLTWKKNHTWALGDALDEPLRVVCGDVSQDRRRRARNRLERGDIHLLVSSGVFKKGTNLKRVDVIIDIAELRSANDTQQKFGRGVRLHPDKQGLLYIDIGTDSGRFGTRAKARASALRALGIPFEKVCVSDAKEALAAVRKWIQSPSPR